jgi:hypothetical protein
VTALTGATLSETVRPTADFRVNVEGDVIVKRNGGQSFDGSTVSTSGNDIPSNTLVYEDGGGSALDDNANFAAAANQQTDGNLKFGVLVPYDKIPTSDSKTNTSGPVTYRFPDLLQVRNNSNSNTHIVVRYDNRSGGSQKSNNGYVINDSNDLNGDGSFVNAAGTGTNRLSYDEVAHIFEISLKDNSNSQNWTRISPTGEDNAGTHNQDPDAAAKLRSGTRTSLAVTVNLTETLGDKIANRVEAQQLDANGGQIRFLDQVWFSTTNNIVSDTETDSSFPAVTF